LAGIFAVVTMISWALIYSGSLTFDTGKLTLFQWHAHEMIFGYAMAVVAGFLLTSVQTWTGQPMPGGGRLGLIVLFWVCARVAFVLGGDALLVGALFNLCFMVLFAIAISSKIFKVRQWRHNAILAAIGLMALAQLVVVIGLMQRDQWLIFIALYGAFYLVILLILIMARRVVPFFTERGVGYPLELKQSRLLDIAVHGGFVLYALCALFSQQEAAAVIAALVFIASMVRLANWYTPGIWKKSLLWSLHLSLLLISAGFLLAALAPWLGISQYLVLHTFALGGIGMITLSMMCRVALGHTGRGVHQPPAMVVLAFLLMALSFFARVIMPLIAPADYALWVLISQLAWIVAFAIFVALYAPMLFRPRVDGKPG